jgi:hypothetical protein
MGPGPGHEEVVADGVQRQHRQRHLQEDLGLLGRGQERAVEHDPEHGNERQRHGACVALALLEQARLKTKCLQPGGRQPDHRNGQHRQQANRHPADALKPPASDIVRMGDRRRVERGDAAENAGV